MKCKDCSLYKLNGFRCPVFGPDIKPTDAGCPKGKEGTLRQCVNCGQYIVDAEFLTYTDEEYEDYVSLCGRCSQASGTCNLCAEAKNGYCDFQQNPIDLPQMMMKTIRQGNSVIQTQVINPARVAETCAKNCKCYIDGECCRQSENQTCGNYKAAYKNI